MKTIPYNYLYICSALVMLIPSKYGTVIICITFNSIQTSKAGAESTHWVERGKHNWETDRCAKRKTVFSTNFGTVSFSKAKILVIPMNSAYMELCLKSCPPSFSVLLLQFLNGTGESWGWDLSVSTGERFQDSIMDEHILVLGGLRDEGEVNETAHRAQNMTVG